MSDQTIFNAAPVTNPQETPPVDVVTATPTPNPVTVDPYADLLGGIKTEDGRTKYATVSDALNSIAPKEEHISTLESENARLTAELATRATVAESVQSLAQPVPTPAPTALPGLAEQDVTRMFGEQFTAMRAEEAAAANKTSVSNTLVELFGENAESEYNKKAAELGVDTGFLNDLAARSPAAVLAYFGKPQIAPQPTIGSVNTTVMSTVLPQTPKVSVMYGASGADLKNEWDACKPTE